MFNINWHEYAAEIKFKKYDRGLVPEIEGWSERNE